MFVCRFIQNCGVVSNILASLRAVSGVTPHELAVRFVAHQPGGEISQLFAQRQCDVRRLGGIGPLEHPDHLELTGCDAHV